MEQASIAVIGVGQMGAPMARRLHAAGWDVLVCDRDETVVRQFEDEGFQSTTNVWACAERDIILVLVNTGEQLERLVLDPGGLADGDERSRSSIVVIMSTVSPDVVVSLASRLRAMGVEVVDAPVSGGETRAADGTLTIMLGGADATIERVRPVMDVLGSNVFVCGELGAAQVTKILNNAVGTTNALLTAELMHVGRVLGIESSTLAEVLEVSTGRNFLTETPEAAQQYYARFSRTREELDRALRLFTKDADLAIALASRAGTAHPVLASICQNLESVDDDAFEAWSAVGRASRPEVAPAERRR